MTSFGEEECIQSILHFQQLHFGGYFGAEVRGQGRGGKPRRTVAINADFGEPALKNSSAGVEVRRRNRRCASAARLLHHDETVLKKKVLRYFCVVQSNIFSRKLKHRFAVFQPKKNPKNMNYPISSAVRWSRSAFITPELRARCLPLARRRYRAHYHVINS